VVAECNHLIPVQVIVQVAQGLGTILVIGAHSAFFFVAVVFVTYKTNYAGKYSIAL
jgi:hypothetical protein